MSFDPERREIFIQTSGRVKGKDPYYRDLVRVNIDSQALVEVIASDHEITATAYNDMMTIMTGWKGLSSAVSPNGNYAVVTRSRADEMPLSLLLDRDGHSLLELETCDIAGVPDGWQWPEPVKLKAADGKTAIYGLVYRPSDFSVSKSYPILSHVFNTPELPFVPKGCFTNDKVNGWAYLEAAALAELGFVVVQVDGRGTSFREKAFLDHCYGWMESASDLADHKSAIEQLAKRYDYMDTTRIGIASYSTGGPGPVQALLQYPDFYKVGVAGCQHDSRLTTATMWGDKYEGDNGPDRSRQYPEALAERLNGKLLMMTGMLDTSCSPAATFRIVEALQKANKDFDLIMLPNFAHSVSPYLIRRAWDYLVRHLLREEPPKEFRLSGVFGMQ